MSDPNSAAGLRDSLIEFRRQSKKSRAVVSRESGLTPFWIEKFEQRVLTNPTARNLDRLRSYLKRTTSPIQAKRAAA